MIKIINSTSFLLLSTAYATSSIFGAQPRDLACSLYTNSLNYVNAPEYFVHHIYRSLSVVVFGVAYTKRTINLKRNLYFNLFITVHSSALYSMRTATCRSWYLFVELRITFQLPAQSKSAPGGKSDTSLDFRSGNLKVQLEERGEIVYDFIKGVFEACGFYFIMNRLTLKQCSQVRKIYYQNNDAVIMLQSMGIDLEA